MQTSELLLELLIIQTLTAFIWNSEILTDVAILAHPTREALAKVSANQIPAGVGIDAWAFLALISIWAKNDKRNQHECSLNYNQTDTHAAKHPWGICACVLMDCKCALVWISGGGLRVVWYLNSSKADSVTTVNWIFEQTHPDSKKEREQRHTEGHRYTHTPMRQVFPVHCAGQMHLKPSTRSTHTPLWLHGFGLQSSSSEEEEETS